MNKNKQIKNKKGEIQIFIFKIIRITMINL